MRKAIAVMMLGLYVISGQLMACNCEFARDVAAACADHGHRGEGSEHHKQDCPCTSCVKSKCQHGVYTLPGHTLMGFPTIPAWEIDSQQFRLQHLPFDIFIPPKIS